MYKFTTSRKGPIDLTAGSDIKSSGDKKSDSDVIDEPNPRLSPLTQTLSWIAKVVQMRMEIEPQWLKRQSNAMFVLWSHIA